MFTFTAVLNIRKKKEKLASLIGKVCFIRLKCNNNCFKEIILPAAYTFYKQIGSDLSPQSCLYFQDVQGSKSLSSCLVN